MHGRFNGQRALLFTTYTSMLVPMRQLGRTFWRIWARTDIPCPFGEDILAVPAKARAGQTLTPQIDGSVAFEDDDSFGAATACPCFPMFPVLPVRPGQTIGVLGSTGWANPAWCLLQQLYPDITAGRITLSC